MPAQQATRLVDLSSPSAEPFRSLRLSLGMRLEPETQPVVVFTSAEAGEGKSTIASNYARVCSMGVKSVALVDGDMRQPSLHQIFELPRVPGLADVCADQAPLDDAVVRTVGLGQLSLLPAGSTVGRPADLLSSPRMATVVEQLRNTYDTVVIDTPPLLSAADAGAVATLPHVGVVLVVDSSSKRRTVTNAIRKLELIEAQVFGIVLNHQG